MRRSLEVLGTLAALVVLDSVLPRAMNPYYFQILMLVGINIVLAVSLNLVNGFTGQFSIGHAGFMAIGAYGSAMITMHAGRGWAAALGASGIPPALAEAGPLLIALLGGGLMAALAGYLVGLPSLRLRGDSARGEDESDDSDTQAAHDRISHALNAIRREGR